jgi:hypothetical protein
MKFLHELYIMTSNVEKKFHHHTTLISKVISHVPILCPDDIKHFTLPLPMKEIDEYEARPSDIIREPGAIPSSIIGSNVEARRSGTY